MAKKFYDYYLPVRPNLDQLKHQAKDLLHAIRAGDPDAIAELKKHNPKTIDPAKAKLADVQLALARAYEVASWPRLVTACRMIHAIWQGDVETVRALVVKDPKLLKESASGVPGSNWGPPMSYAANVGQDAIIQMLREQGAEDVQSAFSRACLQGKVETARRLLNMGARITPGIVMGPCETLHAEGLALQLELGAEFSDDKGDRLSPIALILETYSRNPPGKHGCLEIVDRDVMKLPDTPTMAVHRGRIDLLEKHYQHEPDLVLRTFSHEEIYPPILGCHSDHSLALGGTPFAGATLLHICADFDEIEIARWLIEHGADVNAKTEIDADGFGGHTPLFGCVVSQAYLCGWDRDAAFARLLLDHSADPNARASIRKRLRFVPDETMHEYRDVTPLSWGEQFHGQPYHNWVSKPTMRLIAERGGTK
ncbi:MAG: ankyrin repeat domain-containing protein [Candidatus Sulfotelmatobacter sp.]